MSTYTWHVRPYLLIKIEKSSESYNPQPAEDRLTSSLLVLFLPYLSFHSDVQAPIQASCFFVNEDSEKIISQFYQLNTVQNSRFLMFVTNMYSSYAFAKF